MWPCCSSLLWLWEGSKLSGPMIMNYFLQLEKELSAFEKKNLYILCAQYVHDEKFRMRWDMKSTLFFISIIIYTYCSNSFRHNVWYWSLVASSRHKFCFEVKYICSSDLGPITICKLTLTIHYFTYTTIWL